MRKKIKLLCLLPVAAMVMSGCSFQDLMFWKKNKESKQQQNEDQSGEQGEQQQQKADFVGLTLTDSSVTFDGQAHSISVAGELPEGAVVDYGTAGNSFTDVGVYEITATISKEGYNTLTLSATLTIVAARFTGLEFNGASFTYDGQPHKIEVSGAPEGAQVSYGQTGNEFTDAGSYDITATVSAPGYTSETLHATLVINKAEMEGIVFENATVTYDGQPHSLAPTIPEKYAGAQVSYDEHGNTYTATGSHEINATVKLANYNDWTGKAFLTIVDAHFAGLSMTNATLPYNGEKQTIELEGELPEGAVANYVEGFDGGTNPGTYTIKIEVTAEGYEKAEYSAVLTIVNATFEGITFEDSTVEYDGAAHSIAPSVPAKYVGAEVAYSAGGNTLTDVGSLQVTATVSLFGYNDWSDTKTLTITPASFVGLSLENTTVPFDGLPHTIELTGDLPDGATFTYTPGFEGGTEPGVYTVKGTVHKDNYTDLELSATLTIEYQNAPQALLIEDFENVSDNELNSDPYFFDKYTNSGWTTDMGSSFAAACADNQFIGNGSKTLKMSVKNSSSDWRFNKKVSVTKKYFGFGVDTYIDNRGEPSTTILTVGVKFSNLPLPDKIPNPLNPSQQLDLSWARGEDAFQLSWKLSADAPSNWTHWEVPFDHESISVHSDTYTKAAFDYMLDTLHLSYEELSRYITTVSVDVKPFGNWEDCYVYVDNIQLLTSECTQKVENQSIRDIHNKEYTILSEDDTVFKLTFGNDDSAVLETLNLDINETYNGTFAVANNHITFNAPLGGDDSFTLSLDGIKTGDALKVAGFEATDPSLVASLIEHADFTGHNFMEVVNLDDFESYTEKGVGYDRQHTDPANVSGLRAAYYAEYYHETTDPTKPGGPIQPEKWHLVNGDAMNYIDLSNEGHNDSQAMSLLSNKDWQLRYMTFGLQDGSVKRIGRGSYISFFIKATAAQTVNFRTWYVNQMTSSNQENTSGTCKYQQIALTSEWQHVQLPLESIREVFGISLTAAKTDGRILIDDIQLHGEGDPYAVFETAELPDADYGAINQTNNLKLSVGEGATEAAFYVNNEKISDLTPSIYGRRVTFTCAALTVVARIASNGALKITKVTGTYASAFSYLVGLTFNKLANLNYDFSWETNTANHTLSDANWKQEYYGSDWGPTNGNKMNVRHDNLSPMNFYCNFAVGGGTSYRFTYQPEKSLGYANHLSVDIANDYSGNSSCKYKILLIKSDNSTVYLKGSSNEWETIPAGIGDRNNNVWVTLEADFTPCEVKGIRLVLNSSISPAYIYFDNLKLSYIPPVVDRTYTVKNIPSWWTEDSAHIYAWAFEQGKPGHWYEGVVDGSNMKFTIPSNCTKASFVRVSGEIADLNTWDANTFNGMSKWNRSSEISLSGGDSDIEVSLGAWFD